MKPWYAVVPAALTLVLASPAAAAPGDLGYDVSHNQCSASTPSTFASVPTGSPDFGIVGVNDGVGRTTNPCLLAEAAWAQSLPQAPMLYANGANPGHTSGNWPVPGPDNPHCVNASSSTDTGCAYDYGRNLATDALTRAETQSSISATGVVWWIDVELANSWVDDGLMNTASIQGMVDGLRDGGVLEVGVYSVASHWASITGSSLLATTSYTRATSSTYRAHWGFTPRFPIEDGPVWFGGAGTQQDATTTCSAASLTGGERLLSQYLVPGTPNQDGDYRCADRDLTAPTVLMKAPVALIATGPKVTLGWSGVDAGSGMASFDVQRRVAPYNGGFSSWASYLRRFLTTSTSVSAPSHGMTACWEARARDSAGNVSGWSAQRCAAVPLDDRDLSASTGWTRTTGASGWFASSYTSSTRNGATLTRTGAQTAHLALIAYRCPTCGTVLVMLGSSSYRTVSLASSSSGRVTIELPRFSARTVTVTLKVTSPTGRLVRVDGLVTSRV